MAEENENKKEDNQDEESTISADIDTDMLDLDAAAELADQQEISEEISDDMMDLDKAAALVDKQDDNKEESPDSQIEAQDTKKEAEDATEEQSSSTEGNSEEIEPTASADQKENESPTSAEETKETAAENSTEESTEVTDTAPPPPAEQPQIKNEAEGVPEEVIFPEWLKNSSTLEWIALCYEPSRFLTDTYEIVLIELYKKGWSRIKIILASLLLTPLLKMPFLPYPKKINKITLISRSILLLIGLTSVFAGTGYILDYSGYKSLTPIFFIALTMSLGLLNILYTFDFLRAWQKAYYHMGGKVLKQYLPKKIKYRSPKRKIKRK